MCTLKTKTLMKQIEEDTNNGKIFPAHGLGKKKKWYCWNIHAAQSSLQIQCHQNAD